MARTSSTGSSSACASFAARSGPGASRACSPRPSRRPARSRAASRRGSTTEPPPRRQIDHLQVLLLGHRAQLGRLVQLQLDGAPGDGREAGDQAHPDQDHAHPDPTSGRAAWSAPSGAPRLGRRDFRRCTCRTWMRSVSGRAMPRRSRASFSMRSGCSQHGGLDAQAPVLLGQLLLLHAALRQLVAEADDLAGAPRRVRPPRRPARSSGRPGRSRAPRREGTLRGNLASGGVSGSLRRATTLTRPPPLAGAQLGAAAARVAPQLLLGGGDRLRRQRLDHGHRALAGLRRQIGRQREVHSSSRMRFLTQPVLERVERDDAPAGRRARAGAGRSARKRSSCSSSSLTAMRSAWKVRVAGSILSRWPVLGHRRARRARPAPWCVVQLAAAAAS